MQPAFSLPKQQIRILLLEGISDSAVEQLTAAGYTNVTRLPKALDQDKLIEAVQGVHMLGIRSRTRLTAEPGSEQAERDRREAAAAMFANFPPA